MLIERASGIGELVFDGLDPLLRVLNRFGQVRDVTVVLVESLGQAVGSLSAGCSLGEMPQDVTGQQLHRFGPCRGTAVLGGHVLVAARRRSGAAAGWSIQVRASKASHRPSGAMTRFTITRWVWSWGSCARPVCWRNAVATKPWA